MTSDTTPPLRPIKDIWQDRCEAYARFNADPRWEDSKISSQYFDRIEAAEIAIADHPDTSNRAIELRLWIALSHASTSSIARMALVAGGVGNAIEQGDTSPIIVARDEMDWHEKLIFAAILNLRGENL